VSGPAVHFHNRSGSRAVPRADSFAKWVAAALGRKKSEVTVVLLDAKSARAMNREFRGKDYATNVLSFPFEPMPGQPSAQLGDLVICPAVVAREAKEQRKDLRDHYAHLTVHGVLHLLGHDHEDDPSAAKMEAVERRILATFGIGDPYEIHG
jgi:probable rRNA maturation factor